MRNRSENQIEIHLTLIRHGATISNKEGRYLGKTDESLSREGIRTLEKAVTDKICPGADVLFSGPMKILHSNNAIAVWSRENRNPYDVVKAKPGISGHETPESGAYPQSFTVESSWHCSVIFSGENILTIR